MAPRVSSVFSGAVVAALVAYPVLVYFGLSFANVRWLALFLVGVFLLRALVLMRSAAIGPLATHMLPVAVAGAVLALLSAIAGEPDAMLYYPVLINGFLLFVFLLSLLRPPTIIERLARLRERELPAAAIRYTRKVTVAWAVFFVVNGCISLYTVLAGSLELWTVYNGFVSYVLIACMFIGELFFRRRARSRSS